MAASAALPRARGVLALLLLAAAAASCARASLMGVDLGAAYVKVSVARHGKGLELVTNEQAKRKTPAAVGFTADGERLFGDAAVAFAAKAPARAVLAGRNLVGKCAAPPQPPSLRCPRQTVAIDGAGEFAGEHLVAMLLGMARRQASAALDGAAIKDVVVSVPAWFDHHDRTSIADAARITGLNCLAVVNANTAAAVKYALDGKGFVAGDDASAKTKSKDKGGKRIQTVMFYDLGAASATASIARIANDKKSGVASSVKVLGHAWERDVGGHAFDEVVVKKMANDFDAQRGSSSTPAMEIPRVVTRLRKEAQRVREVLSANTETVIAVPSLYEDLDLRTTMTRADFETGAAQLFTRAIGPVKKVLADVGLSMADVDAVVPFGGASRTPKIQELLCKSLGIDHLNKSINSDEAAVMGNAFFAAMLSSTFRVRKMDVDDVYGRQISAEVERDAKSGGLFSGGNSKPDPQKVVVFDSDASKMPSKKTLYFRRNDDFVIDLYLDAEKTMWGVKEPRQLYSRAKVTGVSKVLKKLKDQKRADGITPKVGLTIHMDRSGFLRIGVVESTAEEVIEVEREVKVKDETSKSETKEDKDESNISGSDEKGSGEKHAPVEEGKPDRDEAPSVLGEEADDSGRPEEGRGDTAEKPKKKKPKTRIEKSKQTLVHRQALVVTYEEVDGSLYAAKMGADEVATSKKLLKDLEAADIERLARADAFNSLEGFVLEVRSILRAVEEGEPLFVVSTEEERDSFISKLDESEDWMFTEEAKKTQSLKDKLLGLKTEYANMKLRADEFEKRPAAIENFKRFLKSTKERIDGVRALHAASTNPRTDVFEKVDEIFNETEAWLADKELQQNLMKATETPALLTRDLEDKMEVIARKAFSVARMKPPEPAPDATKPGGGVNSNNQESSNKENVTSSETNATSAETPDATGTPKDGAESIGDVDGAAADLGTSSDTHDEL